MADPTIAAAFPKALLVFAVSRGADRQTLLDRSGLTSQDLAEPDARVALHRYVALFSAAISTCDNPALALHFGEAVRLQDISLVGLICEVAETTAEVGRQLNRYSRLVVDEGSPADIVRAKPGDAGLWMEVVSEAYISSPFLIQAELARLVCNTRATFGGVREFDAMRFPLAVHFTHPRPDYDTEYSRIFKAPIIFSSDKNALLLDPAFPYLKQPPSDRFAFGVLSERADALLAALQNSSTVRAHVEKRLIPILHTGDAGMDLISRRMGLSRRTLQRKLNTEGVTFEKVLDELRHKLALHYLHGKKVSLNETAYLVGYSEPASFSRAFKRWTGSSPSMIRPKSLG